MLSGGWGPWGKVVGLKFIAEIYWMPSFLHQHCLQIHYGDNFIVYQPDRQKPVEVTYIMLAMSGTLTTVYSSSLTYHLSRCLIGFHVSWTTVYSVRALQWHCNQSARNSPRGRWSGLLSWTPQGQIHHLPKSRFPCRFHLKPSIRHRRYEGWQRTLWTKRRIRLPNSFSQTVG